MKSTHTELYKRLILRFFIFVLFILFVFLVLPWALRVFMPFLIALGVVMAINPLVSRINRRFGISRRVIALIVDLLVFVAIASLLGFLIYTAITEAIALATFLQTDIDEVFKGIENWDQSVSWFYQFIPQWLVEAISMFEDNVISFVQESSREILSGALNVTRSLTLKVGSFFIGLVIAILAAYFMMADYNRISTLARRRMGRSLARSFRLLKTAIINALGGYFKAQLLLALAAFLIMFVALGIYGQPYALLIALFLGIVDLIPLIGTIAILLPWGVFELASGDLRKGVFLIILGIGFFLFRRVIEPKIVGSQTGLHPLVALISIYVGLQISGVWGAILGPVLVMLFISIYKTGMFNNSIADLKDLAKILRTKLRRGELNR